MPKTLNPRLVTLIVGFALVLAVIAGPALHEYPSFGLKAGLIGAAGLIALGGFVFNLRRRARARAEGHSPEDEFTELARLNAGHAAFMMSMVLWLVIFAAQGLFESTRTMLGTGILGQCGFYGICLAYFNRSGSLYED